MTKDDILTAAREAGFETEDWANGTHVIVYESGREIDITNELERFTALVAAHWQKIHEQEMSMMSELCADRILEERERCALVCITLGEYYAECDDFEAEDVAHACASSIRENNK